MSEKQPDLVGEVVGQEFSTAALPGPNRVREKIRVVWRKGQAWRLRHIARGNEPWALPGEEILFGKERIQESIDNSRAVIVVSGPHSGLTSFYHWLTSAFDDFPILAVDLREATLRGETTQEKMQAISHALHQEIRHLVRALTEDDPARSRLESLSSLEDPIDLVTELAQMTGAFPVRLGALAFRGFEALDEEVASRFFGRLRGLLESARRPLDSLGVILLGQSVRALDPQEELPISTLRSLSDIYSPTGLHPLEINGMCKVLEIAEESPSALLRWSGREPLLVHALLQLLQKTTRSGRDLPEAVESAVDSIERERLPAFGVWVQTLTRQLANPATARIVERLLRRDECPDDTSEPRFAFTELFIENWIRLDPEKSVWHWRSDCRRRLAAEANTLKNFADES